jgi:hypothetical protein
VKIDSRSQSLILPGESPEADRRFERAVRLNGARESAKFTVVVQPPVAEAMKAGEPVAQAFQSDVATDAAAIDTIRASQPAGRRESPRWRELYRLVTESASSDRKGAKLNVVA